MKKILFPLCFLFCFALTAHAQLSVVRVDGNKIYLDTSEEKTAPVKGSSFKVILSSEKLTNPQTGKNLGEIYKYSSPGTITEVQPLYAVGEMANPTAVRAGQKAVWEEIVPATPVAARTPAPAAAPVSTRTKAAYEPIEQTVISLTQGNVTAPNAKNIITLSDKHAVTVFSRGENNTLTPQLSWTLPADKKGLSVSAAAVKEGLDQIFVVVYQQERGQISTLVLENKNGTLENTATLQAFVKELGCGAAKKIWGQRPFVLGNSPGNAREVVFEKNKFVLSGAGFNTHHNWIEGLNYYPLEKAGTDNLIFTAGNGTLRLMLTNGKSISSSKNVFGATPLRVQYKQEILKFYPSLQAYGEPGHAKLVAVENTTKLGLLSETFGSYQNGKIHFLDYEKGHLKITDTLDMDGVIYDTACTDSTLLTAEVSPDGTSTVVEILK